MIILTCGHREDDFDKHFSVITQGWTCEFEKCLEYRTVCEACRDEYAIAGTLFDDESTAMAWLLNKENN